MYSSSACNCLSLYCQLRSGEVLLYGLYKYMLLKRVCFCLSCSWTGHKNHPLSLEESYILLHLTLEHGWFSRTIPNYSQSSLGAKFALSSLLYNWASHRKRIPIFVTVANSSLFVCPQSQRISGTPHSKFKGVPTSLRDCHRANSVFASFPCKLFVTSFLCAKVLLVSCTHSNYFFMNENN